MAVNIHSVHPEQAELLLDAAAASPAVRFRSADADRPRAAVAGGVLARDEFLRDEFLTSDKDQGVFEQLHFM